MAPKTTAERALEDLQRLVRRKPPADPPQPAMSGQLPEDLQTDEPRMLGLFPDERRALEALRKILPKDLRLEHLADRALDDATWRFACRCHLDHETELVGDFFAEYAREPMQRTCFLPLELLSVGRAVELFGVTLLPASEVDPPSTFFGPNPRPTMASVVAVATTGTHYGRMSERARLIAEHAVRLLRATLRESRFMPDRQLRFRLGQAHWFDDAASGWKSRPEEGWELELDDQLLRVVRSQELSTLPQTPVTDVERRIHLALRWYDTAQLTADPLRELLYLFFALEAILGNKSQGLKAPALAVRRAMLGLLTSGGFTHPERTYLLYDRIRSAAVHGEEPPPITQRAVDLFSADVRRALNEYLAFARTNGYAKRAQIRKALDSHERRERVARALRDQNPRLWKRYLDPSDD